MTTIDMLGVLGGLLLAEIGLELRRQIRLRRNTLRPLQQIPRR
jgi:hypothetical protein